MKLSPSYRTHLSLVQTAWEDWKSEQPLRLYLLENDQMYVTVTNHGLRLVHLLVAAAAGEPVDVIQGPELPVDFFASTNPYYGAVIGRFANRIDQGRFVLSGRTYQLNCNNGAHHLHGGPQGFYNQVWLCTAQNNNRLVFAHLSPDGAEGYPGNLNIEVSIQLEGNRLKIEYHAAADAPTIINLTHHPFFNLNGSGSTTLDGHLLQLDADRYLPVREDMIPEATMSDVKVTPFDFRMPALLSDRLQQPHEQLERSHGFDHCFVRNGYETRQQGLVATAWSQHTGIGMRIYTNEPGLQLYTGNFMDGSNTIKNGGTDVIQSAFCLETQHFPDSPNQPQFPSVVLEPGQVYHSSTTFEFFNSETTHSL